MFWWCFVIFHTYSLLSLSFFSRPFSPALSLSTSFSFRKGWDTHNRCLVNSNFLIVRITCKKKTFYLLSFYYQFVYQTFSSFLFNFSFISSFLLPFRIFIIKHKTDGKWTSVWWVLLYILNEAMFGHIFKFIWATMVLLMLSTTRPLISFVFVFVWFAFNGEY